MHCACWFPPARSRWPGGGVVLAEKYERQQSSAHTTLGDTDSDLITFSGRPDSIVLAAQSQAAIFTLSDRLGRDAVEVMVPADAVHETHFAAEKVQARNHAAGANAHVIVTGKWAEAAPRSRGN